MLKPVSKGKERTCAIQRHSAACHTRRSRTVECVQNHSQCQEAHFITPDTGCCDTPCLECPVIYKIYRCGLLAPGQLKPRFLYDMSYDMNFLLSDLFPSR